MDLQERFYDIFTLVVDNVSEKQTCMSMCVKSLTP